VLDADDRQTPFPEQSYGGIDVLDGVVEGLGRGRVNVKERFLNVDN